MNTDIHHSRTRPHVVNPYELGTPCRHNQNLSLLGVRRQICRAGMGNGDGRVGRLPERRAQAS